ncbi:MAG: S8 family serine peptidase [Colwellia sp.]|nr:S8 family serine peptidase [Colwellia sp.]
MFKRSKISKLVLTALSIPLLSGQLQAQEQLEQAPAELITASIAANQTALPAHSGERTYIVQLRGPSGVAKAQQEGWLKPSNSGAASGNLYDSQEALTKAYTDKIKQNQEELAKSFSQQIAGKPVSIVYHYTNTINGFAAKLSHAQAIAIKKNASVVNVWADEVNHPTTNNTSDFLGLNGASGQHTRDVKGEDIIIGIIDTGIWPENASFTDDGNYSPVSELNWSGSCDLGNSLPEDEFTCNNKLIGAQGFNEGVKQQGEIHNDFDSPRDVNGHGSHVAGTAAGNANTPVSMEDSNGVTFNTMVSGIAPRARIAAYKVCWNYFDEGQDKQSTNCNTTDSLAAFDKAVEDGVDIINFSISGSQTSVVTLVEQAMLRATQAGVFVAASAGNVKSTTVAEYNNHPSPWITSVANSTYTAGPGDSITFGDALQVTHDGSDSFKQMFARRDKPFAGDIALAIPQDGCDELTNPVDIVGKVALIERGGCTFDQKFTSATDAGAIGVVVFTDHREASSMSVSDTMLTGGGMIARAPGLAMIEALSTGTVTVDHRKGPSVITPYLSPGNEMANSSLTGPNKNTLDLIKPDITAPGTHILAAYTDVNGEGFKSISGTSMASPHIAGMAALLLEENPNWQPARVKSALMTTARQNLTKSTGTSPARPVAAERGTAADPFDFGSGHAQPAKAVSPGLVYDLTTSDYLAFICSQEQGGVVEAGYNVTCAELVENGHSLDATQLNYPSISVGSLDTIKTVYRTVSDVSGTEGTYQATVEAPAGIDVTVTTYDVNGNETEADSLVVSPNGKAQYSLTFTKTASAIDDQVVFGSITWTNQNGLAVRSPIAINPVKEIKIEVPEYQNLLLARGSAAFPVMMQFSGRTTLEYGGLVPSVKRNITTTEGSYWGFNTLVPAPNTKTAYFEFAIDSAGAALGQAATIVIGTCNPGCNYQFLSLTGTQQLQVQLPHDPANTSHYAIYARGDVMQDQANLQVNFGTAFIGEASNDTRIRASSRARKGRANMVRVRTKNLQAETTYVGTVTFKDDEGTEQGTTLIKVQ